MAGLPAPSFDLVVATVDRVDELRKLLSSLERQTHQGFRVLLVDQNDDGRLDPVLGAFPALQLQRLRAQPGLSHARNTALGEVHADLVAFPDDDCEFPPDLLERVARRFADDPSLDGVSGRPSNRSGEPPPSWPHSPGPITRENLWNRTISYTIFLRSELARRVGAFDEALGLGSREPWSSGEEMDYLIRGLDAGARIDYDPTVVVYHDAKRFSPGTLREAGAREGASMGYLLRKHRYPLRTVGRMFIRPVGGALLALVHRDRARARFHLSSLRGRLLGYHGRG
jgi:GT2 family glycosyltransferase